MVRALLHMERRLQDLERKFENKERIGKIVDVKFDKEKKRWFVKMNDGEDETPSGQSSGQSGGSSNETFKSDWLPWQSFSHGSIKMSVPPKKGQHVLMRSPGGLPEMAVAEPYHYGPNTPSPHDKQDEIVKLIEDEEDENQQQSGSGQGGSSGQSGNGQGQQQDKFHTWLHETKDTHHLIIQKKKKDQGGQSGSGSGSSGSSNGSGGESSGASKQATRTLPTVEEGGDEATLQVKATKDGWLVTHGKSKTKIKLTGSDIQLDVEGMNLKLTKDETLIKKGNASISLKEDKIEAKVDKTKLFMKEQGIKIAKDKDFIAVGNGQCVSSKPIIVGADPTGDS